MKILLMSDLHLETQDLPIEIWPEHDIVLLVGDIATGTNGIWWARQNFTKPVLYIAGNHEYYKQDWGSNLQKMIEACENSNVHFLENDIFVFEDTLFIGATLWTDFNLFHRKDDSMNAAQKAIFDFKKIYNGTHYILPEEMIKEHNFSKKFIKKSISESQHEKIVVATHFGIAYESINPRHAGDKLNPYFASDLSEYIKNLEKPMIWVYGHTHHKTSFELGNVKVFSNPLGYPGELGYFEPMILDTEIILPNQTKKPSP